MNKFYPLFSAAALLLVGMGSVNAAPINGAISFSSATGINGAGWDVDTDANTYDLTEAEGFNLDASTAFGDTTAMSITAVEGDFTALDPNTSTATIEDFLFAPLTLTNPLWVADGGLFEFDLNTANVDLQSANVIVLSGTGTIRSNLGGLDDTTGNWSFTANTAGSTFSFSSSVSVVPGPGSLALLGIAGIGLLGARVKKAK